MKTGDTIALQVKPRKATADPVSVGLSNALA